MIRQKNTVDAETLRRWLENNEPVFILDVRPPAQREEWQIPGSHYLDAYKRLSEGDKSVLNEIEIPEEARVVTVCAAGRTSQIAADALSEKGVHAFSLEGGMKAWSKAWNVAKKTFPGFEVLQVRRTGKGCLSYIISSNGEAIIVDASLPSAVYEELIDQHRLSVKCVMETHIHADHLSRSRQIANRLKAPLFLPIPNKVKFLHNQITADTSFTVGTITVRSIPTPVHTFYIENNILITGDTLFTNGVGRPDLKSNAEETRVKAGLLYSSLKRLLSLPRNVLILPAHTNKPVDFDHVMISTAIEEANKNIPLLQKSQESFVDELLQKMPPAPANYLSIVEKNLTGDFSEIDSVDLEAGANRCAIS
jgi:glyoxylase-like metal-dependent hydrolase (beta-lactamase superfamily II)